MIEGLEIDYPLSPCSCGEKKAPCFWFKADESWTIRCLSDSCKHRYRSDFVKPKKKSVELWNELVKVVEEE